MQSKHHRKKTTNHIISRFLRSDGALMHVSAFCRVSGRAASWLVDLANMIENDLQDGGSIDPMTSKN